MEKEFKVQIITADNMTYIEKIKALNELEALDMAHEIYKKEDILDIKVVE